VTQIFILNNFLILASAVNLNALNNPAVKIVQF